MRLYLSRILLSIAQKSSERSLLHSADHYFPHALQDHNNLESLVSEILTHLSFITKDSALFTATTWPAFIAGAEISVTSEGERQREWVARRFQELWEVEPWGVNRGALGVLEGIWSQRSGSGDWIGELRARGVDWLVL